MALLSWVNTHTQKPATQRVIEDISHEHQTTLSRLHSRRFQAADLKYLERKNNKECLQDHPADYYWRMGPLLPRDVYNSGKPAASFPTFRQADEGAFKNKIFRFSLTTNSSTWLKEKVWRRLVPESPTPPLFTKSWTYRENAIIQLLRRTTISGFCLSRIHTHTRREREAFLLKSHLIYKVVLHWATALSVKMLGTFAPGSLCSLLVKKRIGNWVSMSRQPHRVTSGQSKSVMSRYTF